MSETGPHENPLVPNEKLRRIYEAMVELRTLDEWSSPGKNGAKKAKARRAGSMRGEEACRVSTAIDLGVGDLVSDAGPGPAMELLAGGGVAGLVRSIAAAKAGSGKKRDAGWKGRLMPWTEDAEDRLRLALGAAMAFKRTDGHNVVVAYVYPDDLSRGGWRRVLELAGEFELPVIFVALTQPVEGKKDAGPRLRAQARSCGVPGIAVDAADAVALYRVMQESLGRARQDGGPVLIDCARHRLEGKAADPVLQMKELLLQRKIGTAAWLERAGAGLRRKIAATERRAVEAQTTA